MAPWVGLEPTALRLTAECSAIELPRHVVPMVGLEPTRVFASDFESDPSASSGTSALDCATTCKFAPLLVVFFSRAAGTLHLQSREDFKTNRRAASPPSSVLLQQLRNTTRGDGGPYRTRTCNLLLAKQTRYHCVNSPCMIN